MLCEVDHAWNTEKSFQQLPVAEFTACEESRHCSGSLAHAHPLEAVGQPVLAARRNPSWSHQFSAFLPSLGSEPRTLVMNGGSRMLPPLPLLTHREALAPPRTRSAVLPRNPTTSLSPGRSLASRPAPSGALETPA